MEEKGEEGYSAPLKDEEEEKSLKRKINSKRVTTKKRRPNRALFNPLTPKRIVSETPASTFVNFLSTYVVSETPDPTELLVSLREYLSTPSGQHKASTGLSSLNLGRVGKEYIEIMLYDTHKQIEHTYGPRYEGETLIVGDGKLDVKAKDLYIKG